MKNINKKGLTERSLLLGLIVGLAVLSLVLYVVPNLLGDNVAIAKNFNTGLSKDCDGDKVINTLDKCCNTPAEYVKYVDPYGDGCSPKGNDNPKADCSKGCPKK